MSNHVINTLDEKKKKSMVSRVIVGVILAVTGFPAVFLGGWFFFVFISFFLGFAIYEAINAPRKKYHWFVWVFTYIITISYVYWGMVKSNIQAYNASPSNYTFSLENHFTEPGISWYAIVASIGVYFLIGIFHKDFNIHDLAYLTVMSIFVGMGFQCILFLRFHPIAVASAAEAGDNLFRLVTSSFLFLYVVLATFGNDTMAYFVGVLFGKHKMSARVSPNKSWEGFFGGVILGGGLAFGFACLVEGTGHPILKDMPIFGPNSMWWVWVILSFTIPLIGVLGDLSLSFIKRYFGIKDYGKLLAAHGGVLDRVDSLTFCCIYASILLVMFEKGAGFFA